MCKAFCTPRTRDSGVSIRWERALAGKQETPVTLLNSNNWPTSSRGLRSRPRGFESASPRPNPPGDRASFALCVGSPEARDRTLGRSPPRPDNGGVAFGLPRPGIKVRV